MKYYTVREAAKQLGIKKSTLNKRIERGRVNTQQHDGGQHMITQDELNRLLSSSAVTA